MKPVVCSWPVHGIIKWYHAVQHGTVQQYIMVVCSVHGIMTSSMEYTMIACTILSLYALCSYGYVFRKYTGGSKICERERDRRGFHFCM